MNDILKKLTKQIENLEKYDIFVKENEDAIKTYAIKTCNIMVYTDYNNQRITITESNFNKHFDSLRMQIEHCLKYTKSLLELNFASNEHLTYHINEVFRDYSDRIDDFLLQYINNHDAEDKYYFIISYLYNDFTKITSTYQSLKILSEFSEIQEDIILIGGNGSGKSTLANILKGNDNNSIAVIPAQKSLYFSLSDSTLLSTRIADTISILFENNISKSKSIEDYSYYQYQNNQFTKLIISMKEEYDQALRDNDNGIKTDINNTVYKKISKICKVVLPKLSFFFDQNNSMYFYCCKDGAKYHVNSLSEGEKAVIYYAASVLSAKDNSYIVVDEPETYLNPSISNTLWDELKNEKSTCQFIFITHDMNFASARNNSKVAWIKEFIYPCDFQFQFIDDIKEIPNTLKAELLGTNKPILLCEGDDKTSYDYKIYQALFKKNFTVIPVGGHKEIIDLCKYIKKVNFIDYECYGIIDGDNREEENIKSLKKDNIFVLPFNEIEMFLLNDILLNHFVDMALGNTEKINNFKLEFWKKTEDRKEAIALNFVKQKVDCYLETEKIQTSNSIQDISNSLKRISEYDIQANYDFFLDKIDQIIQKKDYDNLLRICNLKGEISAGLINKTISVDYINTIIYRISIDEELQNKIITHYFSDFIDMSNN